MTALLHLLHENPIASLFLILALGTLVGQVSFKGISLGASGVLFVALAFGHFGISMPAGVMTLGVVFFVYAVGLQAGPRFFNSFRKRGLSFALLAIATLVAAALATFLMDRLFGFGPGLAAGLYAGALTTTPGLAAATEALQDPQVPVGYGIAYPFGVIGVVLFVQLLPKIRKVNLADEAARVESESRPPKVDRAWFEVKNPQLHGHVLGDLSSSQLGSTALSRIQKGGKTIAATGNAVLELGDKVRAVGTEKQLRQVEMIIGPRIDDVVEGASSVETRTMVVTERGFVGKTLAQLQIRGRFGVVITRMWRDDREFVPTGQTTLEFGDTIRIVGEAEDCARFVAAAGQQERKLQETRFLPLSLGFFAGIALGSLSLDLPGGASLKLGMAGGPLVVALVASHFGRIGMLNFRVPVAARYFIRELGLMLFLAGAGTGAGEHLVEVIKANGMALCAASVIVITVPIAVAYLLARLALKLDYLSTLGVICGGMTSTPGLGVATNMADSEVPAVAYATVYPVALIIVTLLSQMLGVVLKVLGG